MCSNGCASVAFARNSKSIVGRYEEICAAHEWRVPQRYNPAEAQCDGPQALLPDTFKNLMGQLRQIAGVTMKEFAEVGELAGA